MYNLYTEALTFMEKATKCRVGRRHWFTSYSQVGVPRPDCARCGAPNPRWPKNACTFRFTPGEYCMDAPDKHRVPDLSTHAFRPIAEVQP